MIDAIVTAGLAAMLMLPTLVVLHDTSRHRPAPQGPQPDRGAMTASGVAYVAGTP